MTDQAESLREMFEEQQPKKENNTRIITVASGKGGVGKSIFTVNIGLLLARAGRKVTVMDADFGLANINVIVGVLPKYNLYHVFNGEKKLTEIILKVDENFDIIAGANGFKQLADLKEYERVRFVKDFESLNNNDYLLIDVGAGISKNVLAMIKAADETFIVTTPEPTAVTDAYGIIKAITSFNNNIKINLIVNRVKNMYEAKTVSQRIINISEQFLDVKINYGGFIFDDAYVVRSIHEQSPIVNSYPRSNASLCFNDIAGRIINEKIEGNRRSNLADFFKNLLKTG
ncbi:MAG: MinD/ParA family protein [Spirochaetes bacterium]|nr:MinD/ParA family protein [Spirochaetota bacterium]